MVPIIVHRGRRRLKLSSDDCGVYHSSVQEFRTGQWDRFQIWKVTMSEVAETGFPALPHRHNPQRRSNDEKEEQDSKFPRFILTGVVNDGC